MISHNTAVGGNWLFGTQTPGGTSTTTASSLPVTTGWHVLGFEHVFQPSEAWNFYVDGVLIGTNTSNLPGGLLVPGGIITTLTSGTRTFLIDDEKLWVNGKMRLRS